MRKNVAVKAQAFTHEGGPAVAHLTPEQQLRRSVMACLLWEDQFYEDGESIAKRISEAAQKVSPEVLAGIAIEARERFNLRHAPLLLLEMLSRTGKGGSIVADTVARVVQRADELGEFVAIYTDGGDRKKAKPGHGKTLSAQVRRGLQNALRKFDEYQLAKYDRDGKVKLRDVLRLVRPKPENDAQSALWKRVKDRTLTTPDTWEVALSGGADKKEVFERLLREGKLGYLALLRNLRNMAQANVDEDLVRDAILARKGGAQRVLPFRYISAAKAAPQYEKYLSKALLKAVDDLPEFDGKTIVLVDVSGSMSSKVSGKSDLARVDAAAAVASLINGDVRTFVFSNSCWEIPHRPGLAGVDAVRANFEGGGTELGSAVDKINKIKHDRLIVVTDEQSHDRVPKPVVEKAYLINVASYQNGVGYGDWTHIDGFSEGVLRYIHEMEKSQEG